MDGQQLFNGLDFDDHRAFDHMDVDGDADDGFGEPVQSLSVLHATSDREHHTIDCGPRSFRSLSAASARSLRPLR